ncbi:NeuD/PglB/VioB family sugar acetyltransferase [Intrasporangium sp. YIM S08009]|uniref:NeuD/PglB/VioB family sugar acetyltransferase n=1 Tax=Intrasporangium zincisolvens TaxID=3080018 RepID=UPI002B05F4E8|nr:NeuD/PglB/VioB family sugar acetyltransferase [Intrasporangium sp. YIM S08009]
MNRDVPDGQQPLVLVAAGGLAREAAAAARATGRVVRGCLDDDPATWGRDVGPGLTVLGGLDDARQHTEAAFLVCAGKGAVREQLVRRLGALGIGANRFATVVHPDACLADDTVVGAGAVVLAGVVATSDVVIGDHVVCMPNAVLTHDDRLADFVTICAGVVLGGGVSVGRGAYLGMAASVREGTSVGAGALVGMGAVVLHDVGEGETWVGVPAAPLHGRSAGTGAGHDGGSERAPTWAAPRGTGGGR